MVRQSKLNKKNAQFSPSRQGVRAEDDYQSGNQIESNDESSQMKNKRSQEEFDAEPSEKQN
jgi:hypothetical protein